MARRLYHYTALHHAQGILRDGEIHGGVIPVPDASGELLAGHVPGWQWLTDLDSWRQSWATRVKAACDRTEVRFVVEIPLLSAHRLRRWDRIAAEFNYDEAAARRFSELGGGAPDAASHWFVFRGSIPSAWIADVELRPAEYGAIRGKACRGRP